MNKIITIILLVFSSAVVCDEDIPIWEYPILGSEFIGDNCSEDTNSIIMKISFSLGGDVQEIVFLKRSSISKVNEEAKRYMMEESPFMEFEDMSEEEKAKYSVVKMYYTIPCNNS